MAGKVPKAGVNTNVGPHPVAPQGQRPTLLKMPGATSTAPPSITIASTARAVPKKGSDVPSSSVAPTAGYPPPHNVGTAASRPGTSTAAQSTQYQVQRAMPPSSVPNLPPGAHVAPMNSTYPQNQGAAHMGHTGSGMMSYPYANQSSYDQSSSHMPGGPHAILASHPSHTPAGAGGSHVAPSNAKGGHVVGLDPAPAAASPVKSNIGTLKLTSAKSAGTSVKLTTGGAKKTSVILTSTPNVSASTHGARIATGHANPSQSSISFVAGGAPSEAAKQTGYPSGQAKAPLSSSYGSSAYPPRTTGAAQPNMVPMNVNNMNSVGGARYSQNPSSAASSSATPPTANMGYQHTAPSGNTNNYQGNRAPQGQMPPSTQPPPAATPKTATTQTLTVSQLADKILSMDPTARPTVEQAIARGANDQERFDHLRNIYGTVLQRHRIMQQQQQAQHTHYKQ